MSLCPVTYQYTNKDGEYCFEYYTWDITGTQMTISQEVIGKRCPKNLKCRNSSTEFTGEYKDTSVSG